MSGGIKPVNATIAEHPDVSAVVREKDMEINELRLQLDDKDRMLAALRSAARHRDLAAVTNDSQSPELKSKNGSTAGDVDNSAATNGFGTLSASPGKRLLSDRSEKEDPGKNMDEVSRMLEEMIQVRADSEHNAKNRSIANESRRVSSSAEVPGLKPTATSSDPNLSSPFRG